MKKFLALLLSAMMLLALAAGCGENNTNGNNGSNKTVSADDIPDEMTSEDGKYEIAFITDVGALKDKSFNQGTFDGVKLYAHENNKTYKYYQPANDAQATDDDRYDAMAAAAQNGAKVIVCAGFMQANALVKAAAEFTDVDFVFIDASNPVADANGNILNNVAAIAFQEEQCGYLAGYAVVMEGYKSLGFAGGGGGDNPACCRYGYGFVQGANDAAKALNETVTMNYTWQYGATFSASPELQAMMNGWYEQGTEIVFACGGSIFQSISAAAAENEGKVVGVDVDQSFDSATVVTSAMKGLASSVQWALDKVYAEKFADIAGKLTSLGAKDDSVGLPTATWSLTKFTVDDYNKLFQDIVDGKVSVDSTVVKAGDIADVQFSNLTVNYQ
ncbi:MAG: BMP family ABC transporter substrate-binding protein [Clostridia bacterium]|nr:BMP family ABC transporter substrate-binding protein [Clostridia bacterium]